MPKNERDWVHDKSGMSEVDTREKLETNIRESSMTKIENGIMVVHAPFASVCRWLERQAAITEREYEEKFTELYRLKANMQFEYWEDELAKRDKGIERLKRRSDELEAELRQVTRKYITALEKQLKREE